jgi:hypothetical protein
MGRKIIALLKVNVADLWLRSVFPVGHQDTSVSVHVPVCPGHFESANEDFLSAKLGCPSSFLFCA